MRLTMEQEAGEAKIACWYNDGAVQPFVLKGFGGTGKSTLIGAAVRRLGIHPADVFFGAYTGKAASVLRNKGNLNATTCHRLIYHSHSVPTPKLDAKGQPVLDAKGEPVMERTIVTTLNDGSPLRGASLLVLDECSMIGARMYDDLRSFGCPTLLVGDPGQLQPIKDKSPFDGLPTDHLLTEVQRQALTNPIIELATKARFGMDIPFGDFNTDAGTFAKLALGDLSSVEVDALLNAGDVVITGKTDVRKKLNDRLRTAHSFGGIDYPTRPGAKVICRKNMHDLGIMNGEIATTAGYAFESTGSFGMDIIKDGDPISVEMSKARFVDYMSYSRKLAEFEWGYAITCHMAQGSEWPTVVVVDDQMQRRNADIRKRWLYTAITRASDNLILLDAPRGI